MFRTVPLSIIRSFFFLIIKPTKCTNFSNLFLEANSTCFGQFLCPSFFWNPRFPYTTFTITRHCPLPVDKNPPLIHIRSQMNLALIPSILFNINFDIILPKITGFPKQYFQVFLPKFCRYFMFLSCVLYYALTPSFDYSNRIPV